MSEKNGYPSRRKEIVDAARTLAAEQGWPAVTVRAVASRIGCSAPALYQYFRDKDEILDAILKAVKPIDSSIVVVWDDHDDISVRARDMFQVRIVPRWENSYNIEAMVRNEDRIYVTNQTIEQVIEFLKINLKNATTATQKAYDKSKQNADLKNDKTSAPDKGMPQKDKPKILPLTNEPPKT